MYILVVAELGYYAIIISMASILKGYSHHKMLRHIAKLIHNYVHIDGGLTSGNRTDLESAGSKDPSSFLLYSGATHYAKYCSTVLFRGIGLCYLMLYKLLHFSNSLKDSIAYALLCNTHYPFFPHSVKPVCICE